jgi:hypothetical protein
MGAAALPWREIIKGATLAVSLARDVMKHQSSQPKQSLEATGDPKSQLGMLTERTEALEASAAEQAQVVKVLAEEVQSLARRAMIGYWVGVAGVVLGIAAIALAIVLQVH